MSEEQIHKRRTKRDDAPEANAPAVADSKEKLKEGIDDLLDEIDSVLEENAEEFVRSYVQKGGQ
jgi:ubiquitin-like protein Pup